MMPGVKVRHWQGNCQGLKVFSSSRIDTHSIHQRRLLFHGFVAVLTESRRTAAGWKEQATYESTSKHEVILPARNHEANMTMLLFHQMPRPAPFSPHLVSDSFEEVAHAHVVAVVAADDPHHPQGVHQRRQRVQDARQRPVGHVLQEGGSEWGKAPRIGEKGSVKADDSEFAQGCISEGKGKLSARSKHLTRRKRA